jgi:hypothetical protein
MQTFHNAQKTDANVGLNTPPHATAVSFVSELLQKTTMDSARTPAMFNIPKVKICHNN